MHGDLVLSQEALYAFLLVLARVGGALVFVPLPGLKNAPDPVRAALAGQLRLFAGIERCHLRPP